MTNVGTYSSSSTYQFGGSNAGAGTYYLVFTLESGNAWSDGDTLDYVYFTLVIGGNVEKPTSIGTNLTADANDATGRTYTGNLVSGSEATINAITSSYYTVALYDAEGKEVESYSSTAAYQFGGSNAGAGTYYLVFTLESGYLWTDGTDEPREYTFIVTE